MADLAYYLLTKYSEKMGSHRGRSIATALFASVIFKIMRKRMVFGGFIRNTASTDGTVVFACEQFYT